MIVFAAARTRAPEQLGPLTLTLRQGVTAVVGGPGDGVRALLALVAGRARCESGSVTVFGHPSSSAEAARATAYVPLVPLLPGHLDVAELLDVAAELRGEAGGRAGERLAALGVGALAKRATTSLSPVEARAALVVEALTSQAVSTIAIEEPRLCIDPRSMPFLLPRLRARAGEGALVVLGTASLRDARELGTDLLRLARGGVAAQGPGPALGISEGPVRLRMTTKAPRALLVELAREPAIGELASSGDEVTACGAQLTEAARAVGAAVARAGVDVQALSWEPAGGAS